jgi:hypothetical protein
MDKAIITGTKMGVPSTSLATPSFGENNQRFSHKRNILERSSVWLIAHTKTS